MQRCTFCREEIGTVHWAFDGVSEQPVPACRECCEKLRLKVWKVDAKEPKDMPVRADCVYCGIPLPARARDGHAVPARDSGRLCGFIGTCRSPK